MQTYQSTPDYYNDFISHASHKYISKHKSLSGKWVYKYYKNKSTKLGNKASQYRDEIWNYGGVSGKMNPLIETTNIKGDYKSPGRSLGVFTYRTVGSGVNQQPLVRSGRPRSYGFDSGSEGTKTPKTTKIYGNGIKERKRKTAQRYQNSRISKDEERINKGLKKLEAKERSLRELRKHNNQIKTYGSATERFKARMKQKEQNKKISEQLKKIKESKNKLNKSRKSVVKSNGNYSTWNR